MKTIESLLAADPNVSPALRGAVAKPMVDPYAHEQLRKHVHKLQARIRDVIDLLHDEIDIDDSEHGPIPNRAMRIVQILEGRDEP